MKILFITPHLSTGGAPQYLLKKIDELNPDNDVYCVEYTDMGGSEFIVQKTKIQNILKNKLFTLSENKNELLEIIKKIDPEIIHFEELPEYFCDTELTQKIYSKDRKYKIIETSHDSSFDVKNKVFFPDKFIFVSEFQKSLFSELNIESTVIEYPIEYKEKRSRECCLQELGLDPNKFHILNVGLFTPRKNQLEIVEYARQLINENVQFHFVGNQAVNFKEYWEPIMKEFPVNCKWWGERSDVDTFYEAMDLFLFTSKGTDNDKETNPLVLREAIGWNIPILMYDLPVYQKMHHKYKGITFLEDFDNNLNLIKSKITKKIKFNDLFAIEYVEEENKFLLNYLLKEKNQYKISIKDKLSNVPIYWFNATFENYTSYFVVPCDLSSMNFKNSKFFESFKIEIYDLDNNFICDTSYFLKKIEYEIEPLNIKNPFDCIYPNYKEMFLYKNYDCYDLKNLDLVIDIGANSGLFSKLCLDNNAKHVICVEPNKQCLINLNSILSNYNNYTVIDKALSFNEEELDFYTIKEHTTIGKVGNNSNLNNNGTEVSYKVPTISLNKIIKNLNIEKISLLKMDIEGFEYKIFEHLDESTLKLIDNLIIEFHDNHNGELLKLIKKLEENGFKLNQIRNQNDTNNAILNIKENPITGTLFFNRVEKTNQIKKPLNLITLTDCFVSNDSVLNKLNSFLDKFSHEDLFLVTNTTVSDEILEKTKFTFYDSNNRLFSDNFDFKSPVVIYRNINDFVVNDVFRKNNQRHGLSVLVNLFTSIKMAKSLGYTHFQRFEVDDLFGEKSINFIKTLPETLIQNKKKGIFYTNPSQDDISFHYFMCEIDYFLNIIPEIKNEKDYKKSSTKNNDFISVEKFIYNFIKKDGNLILKETNDQKLDFPDTEWNTNTSETYYDTRYDGYINKIYKKYINGKDTNDYILFSYNLKNKPVNRKIIVTKNDATQNLIQHSATVEGEWCFTELGNDVYKIDIFQDEINIISENIDGLESTINFLK